MNHHIRYVKPHVSRGYTSYELSQLIGVLPDVTNREYNGIPEWKPSKYFDSIEIADEDIGRSEDVLFYGIHTPQYHTVCNTPTNMKRGLIKRLLYGGKMHLKEFGQSDLRKEYFSWSKKWIEENFTPLEAGYTFESALEAWLAHSERYTLKTKDKLRKIQKLILSGRYESKLHGKGDPLGLKTVKIFIKNENYPEVKEPRIISPCSEELKALIGGFFHVLEEHLIHSTPFFVKTLNRGKIIKKINLLASRHSCFMGSDFSSFEGSQDIEIQINFEREFFRYMFQSYPEVTKYIDMLYTGRNLYYRDTYLGTIYGKRMSGDMHTSIGNSILNASLWNFCAYKTSSDLELLVEGDDAFLCSDEPLDVNIIRELGFDCKLEGPSTNPDDITFLSMFRTNGKLFGNVPKILDKIGVVKSSYMASLCRSNRKDKTLRDYAFTKAYCFFVMFQGTPIVEACCRKIMKEIDGHIDMTLMPDYFSIKFGDLKPIAYVPIYDEVRKAVAEKFGISVQLQLELEEQILNAEGCSFEILHTIFPEL